LFKIILPFGPCLESVLDLSLSDDMKVQSLQCAFEVSGPNSGSNLSIRFLTCSMGLFSENSSDISDWTHLMATATQHGSQLQSQAATEPQQPLPPQNAFANDSARAAVNVLRDSLANDLLQWQILETKLRRAERDVPQYCRMVFTKCEVLVTRFDNLSECELGQEMQAFCDKFASLKRDLGGVLDMMSEEYKADDDHYAALLALDASLHNSPDPPTHGAV
jgi:hypothetical protein